jgi:hypothetical protein
VSNIQYFELIDEFCLLTGLAQPRMITEGGTVLIDEVAFSLQHDPQADDTLLYIYAEFGALPRGREMLAAVALLEANLFLYSGASPAFAIAPGTEQVVMAHHCALAQIDAQGLHALLVDMAAKAGQWRADYFLDPATSPFQLSQPNRAQAG